MPFFVRDPIRTCIQKRIEALQKGYRQNVGLIGPAGLGKTFVLSSIFHSLTAQAGFIPIYISAQAIDIDQLIDRWLGAMLTGMFLSQNVKPLSTFQSLLAAADPIIPNTVEKIRHLKKMMRHQKPPALLKELFALTSVLSAETGKKIVLILDEFQALENLPVPDPFLILGKEIMVEKNTLYLVASSTPAKASEIFRDKLSLLFGNFEVIHLRPLNFSETIVFLQGRLPGKKFSDDQVRLLMRMTDGSPVYLELLSDQLVSRVQRHAGGESSDSVTIQDADLIEVFCQELICENGRIAQIFEKRLEICHRLAKDTAPYLKALLAVSHGRKKVLGIATFIEKKILETKKILQRLVQEDLIAKRGAFYTLEDPLFRIWLTQIYQRKNHLYTPDDSKVRQDFEEMLRRQLEKIGDEDSIDITARVEALFKEFRNDVLEVDQKKILCPQFSELAFKPTNGRVFPLFARNAKTRWLCQIARQTVMEEDVSSFLEELKRIRKNVQKKIMITLGGIEQNAKLMAQEAEIQLWDLQSFNALLDLYDQPKMILLSEKEKDGSALGSMAQDLHPASHSPV